MKKTFTLWPVDMSVPHSAAMSSRLDITTNITNYIDDLPLNKTWDITIKPHVTSKTAEQRNWFHKLCELFGQEIGLTKGDVKMLVKGKLMGWKNIVYAGVTLTVPDGKSEDLSKAEYAQLIETLYQIAAESGVYLPQPDHYNRQ